MAVMNRFAPVTESWKQTQPWVTSKCCVLSEGILFEQVFWLNTSFFLLLLANRAAPRSAVSVPPYPALPALVLPSLLPGWNPKLPSALAPCSQRVLKVWCHKITLCPEFPHCCGQDAVSPHLLFQMGNDCSVSGTEKHRQLLSVITFPLLEDQQTSPRTGDGQIIQCISQQPLQGCCLLFSTMVLECVKKGL